MKKTIAVQTEDGVEERLHPEAIEATIKELKDSGMYNASKSLSLTNIMQHPHNYRQH